MWVSKQVSVEGEKGTVPVRTRGAGGIAIPIYESRWQDHQAELVSVNSFWVTLKTGDGKLKSEPLEKLVLSFDNDNQRLKIIIRY